ncbi:AtzE family amidohydrolase [Acetobacter fallax]|uniref:AtzE family amidohydrolase n=1 Tax=Acetobacter fallax TaxID=1737473 RepID=A0ABX0K3X6_9PROT|nr:AtzE family amidohydrolase [Acetobacter fallax]NHO31089.1 AtzE family amidohydrolase [Acetobacter fallax]NHO34646.1 AtzE family amidohydrolase [Acetobacter fallax]
MTLRAATLANNIRFGLRTAREVIETTLHTLKTHDPAYGCVTRLLSERALRAADTIDARIRAGEPTGPLAGVPFGVKDLFDVEGIITTAGSTVLKDNEPAKQDAAVIRRLVAAGAIPVATLNMDEFAYGFATENSHYGTTKNPRDPTRLAGGSSGGSAAAVAAGMLPITLGSDTNGSIRVPASLCGVWGLRPTQGRLPLEGVYPFAASFDTIGPFAGTSGDLKLAFEAMDGRAADAASDVGTLRVARLGGWFERDLASGLIDGIERIMSFLQSTKTVELPEVARARAAAFIITASEGGNLHLPRLRHRAMEYDPATRDRLMAGALLPASPIIQAHRLRNWFREHLHGAFSDADILIAPATVGPAPRIDQPTIIVDGKAVSARANLGLFTQPLTLGGFPILAAPLAPMESGDASSEAGLPLGVQIIAAPGQEQALFAIGAALEHAGLLGYPLRGTSGESEV